MLLTISVPSDARVYINGKLTQSVGEERNYVSPGLTKGWPFKYVVRVEVVRNNQLLEETQTIFSTGGEHKWMVFGLGANLDQNLAARL